MFTKDQNHAAEVPADASAEQTEPNITGHDNRADDATTTTATNNTDPATVGDSTTNNGSESGTSEGSENDENNYSAETFSRSYVEKLRRENAGYRERANRADELAQRLHTALVAATGRMADPTDLPFDAAHLDDDNALSTAIDELLSKKPHLATRRLFGDIGQGNRGAPPSFSLLDTLKKHA